jgi:hypothetical protein
MNPEHPETRVPAGGTDSAGATGTAEDTAAAGRAARGEIPAVPAPAGRASVAGGPEPEPIRFFGTTWVERGGGYRLRRAGVAAGSLAAAAGGAVALRLGHEGMVLAEVGGVLDAIVIVMFSICSAIAFQRTWQGFGRRPENSSAAEVLRGVRTIGFIGVLLAWFFRTAFVEAPGEKLHRAEYERALSQYEKRRGNRTGNPAARSRRPSGAKRKRP